MQAIIVTGEPEEIADFVQAVQDRQKIGLNVELDGRAIIAQAFRSAIDGIRKEDEQSRRQSETTG